MQLNIRLVQRFIGSEKSAGLGDVAGQSSPSARVVERLLQPCHRLIGRVPKQRSILARIKIEVVDMVGKIVADLRQIAQYLDTEAAQMLAWSDAGQHQKLRRSERARAEEDLARGLKAACRSSLPEFDAAGAPPLKDDALRCCPGDDLQIGPMPNGIEIGAGGAHALSVFLRDVIKACAFQPVTAEIAIGRKACIERSRDKSKRSPMRIAKHGDVERPVAAVRRVGTRRAGLERFGPAEER